MKRFEDKFNVQRTRAKAAYVPLLVIGCGNTLRRDDGLGPRIAEAVAALNLPGVQTLTCHQLTPELAPAISEAQAVVFVDASVNRNHGAKLQKLLPRKESQILAHACEPASLLALAMQLYGRQPKAWCLGVPALDLGFGEGLSSEARNGLDHAVTQIARLANRCLAAQKNIVSNSSRLDARLTKSFRHRN